MATLTVTITDSDASSADLVNAIGRKDETAGMAAIATQLSAIVSGSRRGRVRIQTASIDRTFAMGPASGTSATITFGVRESSAQLAGLLTHPAAHPHAAISELIRFVDAVAGGAIDATVTCNVASGAFSAVYDEGFGAKRTQYAYIQSPASSYYIGAAGAGPNLTAGAGSIGVLFRPTTVPNVNEHIGIQKITTGTRGYRFQLRVGSNVQVQARIEDGTTNRLHQNNSTITAGKLHAFAMVMSTNGGNYELVTYRDNNTPINTAISWTAAYAPPTTEQLLIANSSPGTVAEGGIVAVVVANATAMTPTQIATWMSAVKAGGSLSFPTGTTHLWDAADAAATWVDSIAGVSLSKVGTPTVVDFTADHA